MKIFEASQIRRINLVSERYDEIRGQIIYLLFVWVGLLFLRVLYQRVSILLR